MYGKGHYLAILAMVYFCTLGLVISGFCADGSPVTVLLGQGLSIDIPRSWTVIAGDQKKELDSSVQRMLDLAGFTVQTGTLLAGGVATHRENTRNIQR